MVQIMACYHGTKPLPDPMLTCWWYQWEPQKHILMRTINNAHYLWWSTQEPPICSLGRVKKTAYKQCNIKRNHNLDSKLAQKLHDGNVWHVYIIKTIVIQFFMHFIIVLVPIMAKFFCFSSSFVPDLDANSEVPKLTTRDKRSTVDGSNWFCMNM